MAFDGIITKTVVSELKNIVNYKIDKIFEPNKNTVTLGLYSKSSNLLLNICIDAKYCRINLTTHPKPNPIKAANFCMLLRKHILGYKITDIYTKGLERVVFIELLSYDDIDKKTLIIELMGKHSNVILVDKKNIIIDSLRHTDSSLNSYRDIFPGKEYIFPSSDKKDFTKISSFEDFYSNLPKSTDDIANTIFNLFTGFSLSFIKNVVNKFNVKLENRKSVENLFNYINSIINCTDNNKLEFLPIYNENSSEIKDYILNLDETKNIPNDISTYKLNFFLDDFYYNKETFEEFINSRNTILKLILDLLNKYNKRLKNINEKLVECENMDIYRLYGELITSNLYKLKDIHLSSIELENYYDNNKPISIPLDKKYTPSVNAKRYFKKYSKLKNALDIINIQKKETLDELNYIESIVYELENCTTNVEVQEIFEEISENVIFKEKLQRKPISKNKKQLNSKKKKESSNFSPILYNIYGHTILVGRNNKENDYLTLKYANNTDIWFHTKDIHGSHVILKTAPNEQIDDNLLIECAKIAAKHSKAKSSSNIPVDYCFVKFVKKPVGSKPGMVIYTNNKTLYVTP